MKSSAMSLRRSFRIVLSLLVIGLMWWRVAHEWSQRSGLWLTAAVLLTAVLIGVIVLEVTGVQQKWRRMRDEVPKRPLGLE